MKRLHMIFICIVILTAIVILMIFDNAISTSFVLSNIIIGSTTSLMTAFLLELLSNMDRQKRVMENFLWQGVIAYEQDLEELFLYSRDFLLIEKYFKNISQDESDWKAYIKVFNEKDKILEPKINGCIREIRNNGAKYSNHIAYISDILSEIDRRNFLFLKNKKYIKCYDLYKMIENINWTLCEAYGHIQNIEEIINHDEKMCSALIVCRWISGVYCGNYDRGIVDIDIEDEIQTEDIKVKHDFDRLIQNLINSINKK